MGFSLVELLVSVAITALIMVGISAFFSNSFRTMFESRTKTSNALDQLIFSNVLQKQFIKGNSLQAISGDGSFVILKNNPQKTYFPFSYLGLSEGYLALKDFFVFNGQEGDTASSSFKNTVSHPAGITQMAGKYYVAAPLENSIYECTVSCNKKLAIEGLSYPMDLANDGENLYVTDSGNNRVLKIMNVGVSNDLEVLISDLNFPTGIEYYSAGKGHLFVSDTYNHQIKAILLSDNSVSIVAGGGTNKKCDSTAQYCQLSYPTGLVFGNDGSGESLYIADTGNRRILKVSDPGKLSVFDLSFSSPQEAKAIKEVKVVFPANTTLDNAVLESITSDNNNFQTTGATAFKEHIFDYQLSTKLTEDTVVTNACKPEPCLVLKNKIAVEAPDLFTPQKFNEIMLGDDANNVLKVGSKKGSVLSLLMNAAAHHPLDTLVILASKVPASTKIEFKFTNVDTSAVGGGFKPVLIQMYDLEGKLIASQKNTFRFGDGELGTSEDLISVLSENHPYPTGLGWSGNALVFAENPEYPTVFKDFDYLTGFKVEELKFESKNEGHLLEMKFKTVKNPDSEEEKLYEDHIFNAALKP